jgi:transcription elongation factor Elf1
MPRVTGRKRRSPEQMREVHMKLAEDRKCPACGKRMGMVAIKYAPQSITSKCRWCGFEQEVPR